MQRAMRGEDVPKVALDAARALFSYGSTKPPEEGRFSLPRTRSR